MNETTSISAGSGEGADAARRIADWKFVRPIGKGGAAEVFEVENERLGTRAALKLFSCAKDKDDDVVRYLITVAARNIVNEAGK